MNLKYYLRGLGIGVVVTALIMGIVGTGQKESLSDEEIKQRASELGMVEEGMTLAEVAKTPEIDGQEVTPSVETDGEDQEDAAPEETPGEVAENEAPEETPAQEAESGITDEPAEVIAVETPEATEQPTPEPTIAPTPRPTRTPAPTPTPTRTPRSEGETEAAGMSTGGETTVIEVRSGDGSYTVCQKLEAAGLIASAAEYDTYLCQNGYDRKLRSGSHEIPAGASTEEIARILSGM